MTSTRRRWHPPEQDRLADEAALLVAKSRGRFVLRVCPERVRRWGPA
jgi:uncharacterized protein (DUF1778 family)